LSTLSLYTKKSYFPQTLWYELHDNKNNINEDAEMDTHIHGHFPIAMEIFTAGMY